MDEDRIILKTVDFVKQQLGSDCTGHDWWHIYRVWKLSLEIASKEENVNLFIIQLAALLHDVADQKLNEDTKKAQKLIVDFLNLHDLEENIKEQILFILENVSFSNNLDGKKINKTKELEIVQDADRLDALGAIGIARSFFYGGSQGRIMYDPQFKPKLDLSKEEYISVRGTTIAHFYEKLLLLKDLMNTETAKKIAEKRHQFMVKFLERFYQEWEGKK